MNGMRIPVASAGSNHAGGKETGTPQVTWPAGGSARAGRTVTRINATRASEMRLGDLFMAPPVRSATCQVSAAGAACQWSLYAVDFALARSTYCRGGINAHEYRPASPSASHHAGKDLSSVPRSRRNGQMASPPRVY